MQKLKINTTVLVKVIAFVVVGSLIFSALQKIFLDKNSYREYRAWKHEENVDIVVLGNSHAKEAIATRRMEEDFRQTYGKDVSVFNYALFGMRIEQMYYFAKEIFKYHVPDLVILETYAFCPLEDENRAILARRAFDALPLSLNKIQAINYCVRQDHWSYYFPFVKYHTRWKELYAEDIALLYSEKLWEGAGDGGSESSDVCSDPGDGWFQQDVSAITDCRELTPSQKECFEKLVALLEDLGVQLLLVSVPYKEQMDLNSLEMVKINHYLEQNYVNDQNVKMLDMNRMWPELAFDYSDLVNEGHVGKSGSDKVTRCLLECLKQQYPIADMAD